MPEAPPLLECVSKLQTMQDNLLLNSHTGSLCLLTLILPHGRCATCSRAWKISKKAQPTSTGSGSATSWMCFCACRNSMTALAETAHQLGNCRDAERQAMVGIWPCQRTKNDLYPDLG